MKLEWLIDMMKEWVLSLAYATEAWVLGKGYQAGTDMPDWTMPLSVSGILVPDATCTYFKTGTHEGKPYYRRTDGEWFIWWNGVNRWFISTVLGTVGDYPWERWGVNMLGIYTPVGLSSGAATVSEGYKYLKTGFIDRGDPAVNDWTETTLIRDSTWHDLDLSAIVPAGAKAVLLRCIIRRNIVNAWLYLKTKDNANMANVHVFMTKVANLTHYRDAIVHPNSNRIIQYALLSGTWVHAKITVAGWWL